MKNRWFKIVCLLLTAALAGCSTEEWGQEKKPCEVKVALKFTTAAIEEEYATRAEQPLKPEYENSITHLWILQFDREGIRSACVEKDFSSAPVLSADINDVALKTGISTICVVGNLKEKTDWPDNLEAFKQLVVDMGWLAKRGTTEEMSDKQVVLFGYYEGNLQSEGQSVNIVMGRLVCRLNIAVSAKTAGVYSDVKIQLQKAQTSSYLFPGNMYLPPVDTSNPLLNPYPEEAISGALGVAPVYRYYYMAENINTGNASERTQLKITATKGGAIVEKTVDLGRSDISDYSLLRNNNYTFNIVLK